MFLWELSTLVKGLVLSNEGCKFNTGWRQCIPVGPIHRGSVMVSVSCLTTLTPSFIRANVKVRNLILGGDGVVTGQ